MSTIAVTVEAIFEDGILRPITPLPLSNHQRVTLTLHIADGARTWPDDVAAIYQEIAVEDRRLAKAMSPTLRETWPTSEPQP